MIMNFRGSGVTDMRCKDCDLIICYHNMDIKNQMGNCLNPYSCRRLYSLKRTMDGTKRLFNKDEIVDIVDDICNDIRMCKFQRKSFIERLERKLDD